MALIFDLRDRTEVYPVGSAEHLYQELDRKYDKYVLSTYCSYLSRYSGVSAIYDFNELCAELEAYGAFGKNAAKFIRGYIGMDTELPCIDPERWSRIEDPRTSGGGIPGTLFLGGVTGHKRSR